MLTFQFSLVNADEKILNLGKNIYNGKGMCVSCHVLKSTAKNEEGIGKSLDELNPTSSTLKNAIINGKGSMPALGNMNILTNEEIDAVIYFIKKELKD